MRKNKRWREPLIVCVDCGLNLRCKGGKQYAYYKDMAKARQLPCPAGGFMQVRKDLVSQQFGDLLRALDLPKYWREEIRQQMIEIQKKAGTDHEAVEREKERLKLKRSRLLKLYKDGYIDDEEFEGETAAIALTLHQLETPNMNGVSMDEVIAAGERLPGMAVLWGVATVEERRGMVERLLELGGLYYDLDCKMIAGIQPQPAFLPVLRLLRGIEEQDALPNVLVMSAWAEKRRKENSPTRLSHSSELGSDGGTDGFRFLCHQFSTSSLPRQEYCIRRCNVFWQKMKYFREATLLFSSTDDQGQSIRTTVFPLNSGLQSYIVWWSRRNRSERWQQHTGSRMKRSVASFVLLRKSMYSKKCNCTTCRDRYSRHVFLLCSRTDSHHSQYHGYQRHQLFSSTKGHPNSSPPLQVRRLGW